MYIIKNISFKFTRPFFKFYNGNQFQNNFEYLFTIKYIENKTVNFQTAVKKSTHEQGHRRSISHVIHVDIYLLALISFLLTVHKCIFLIKTKI